MSRRFNGLAALRAVAALVVVVAHVELQKHTGHIPTLFGDPSAFWPDPHLAVVLFFVLSGFLISFILVDEKQRTGSISLRNFYMRRVLRIWPLYYLVVALSLLLVRPDYDATAAALTLTIFPNISHAIGTQWPGSPQIWSIGVEEQFYLLLPLLIRWIPVRRLPLLMVIFFAGYTLLPFVIGYINARTVQSDLIAIVDKFFYGTKFNCMSIGCLLGILAARSPRNEGDLWDRLLSYLRRRWLAYLTIFLSFGLWLGHVAFGVVTDEAYSVLFGIMILNVATNENLTLNIESVPLRFLGKISYGIYMYHWLVILLVMKGLPHEMFRSDFVYNISLYSAVLAITVLTSWASFASFEGYFLSKKRLFRSPE